MKKTVLVTFLVLLLTAGTNGMAQVGVNSSDLWVFGGVLKLEDQDAKGVFGIRYGLNLNPSSGVEGTFGLLLLDNATIYLYNANLLYDLPVGIKLIPFVTGGVGAATFSIDNDEVILDQAMGGTSLSVNFGGGIRYYLSERMTFRFDARDVIIMYGDRTIGDQTVDVGSMNNLEFTAGITMFFL